MFNTVERKQSRNGCLPRDKFKAVLPVTQGVQKQFLR